MARFDVEAARAAGYSDAEIEAIIAKGPPEHLKNAAPQHSADWRIQALGTLPTVGAGVGGTLGFLGGAPAGGVGAVPGSLIGAGLGGASGRILEQYGRDLLGAPPAQANVMGSPIPQALDIPETALGHASAEALGGTLGAGVIGVGRAISRIPDAAKGALGKMVARQIPGVGHAMDAADLIGSLRGAPGTAASRTAAPIAEEAAAPALTGIDKLRAMKPLRANASAATKQAHLVEAEQALAEAKLPEPAKKRILEQLGHAPRKPFRPGKAPAAEAPAPKPGTAQSRLKVVKDEPSPFSKEPVTGKPKHEVDIYSKRRGEHITPESMNQVHIENKIAELAAKNPKPGTTAYRQLQALFNESKYRLQTTGIHVGHR